MTRLAIVIAAFALLAGFASTASAAHDEPSQATIFHPCVSVARFAASADQADAAAGLGFRTRPPCDVRPPPGAGAARWR